jgi:hypothetical protein
MDMNMKQETHLRRPAPTPQERSPGGAYRFMKILIFILVTAVLAIKSPAQIAPTLKIQASLTNVVTVTANTGSREFPYTVLQVSTNLPNANWVNFQTNVYVGAGSVVFTNIPATNEVEYFRVYEF